MIPTYRPNEIYLRQTLESVLQQDPGPAEMQIEVVDDCSPDVDVAATVNLVAGARVRVSRTSNNLGLAGCWNACIERARGDWIHILHQDDLVRPGFYQAMRHGAEQSTGIGAAFCRHEFIDAEGRCMGLSDLECVNATVLESWIMKIGLVQRIQTPSIVVKRSTYEACGGYLRALTYTLDWEMWQRIAIRFPVWYEPSVLAAYRMHSNSATGRLQSMCDDLRDCCRAITTTEEYFPQELTDRLGRPRRSIYGQRALDRAAAAARHGNISAVVSALRVLLWLKPDISGLMQAIAVVMQLGVGLGRRIARRLTRPFRLCRTRN